MKTSKLLTLGVISIMLNGCFEGDRIYTVTSTSYVCEYMGIRSDTIRTYGAFNTADPENCYSVWFVFIIDWSRHASMISKGKEYDQYMQLCEKHSDLNYARKVQYMAESFDEYSYYDLDPVEIEVTSDADFDEQHPAGTSLRDLFYYNGVTPYPFIKNGYKGDEYTVVRKRLDEVTYEEMMLTVHDEYAFHGQSIYDPQPPAGRMNRPFISLPRENLPTKEQIHTLTVTLTDDCGRTYIGTVMADFSTAKK